MSGRSHSSVPFVMLALLEVETRKHMLQQFIRESNCSSAVSSIVPFAQKWRPEKTCYMVYGGQKPFNCSTCDASFTRSGKHKLKKYSVYMRGISHQV